MARGAVDPARRDVREHGLPGRGDLLFMAVPAKTVEARRHFKRVLRVRRYMAIGTISLSEREMQLSAEKTCLC